jgi:hypothetical protein
MCFLQFLALVLKQEAASNKPNCNGNVKRLFVGWMLCSQVEANFQGRRFLFHSQAYRRRFASSPRDGRGDTPYFARTPVIVSGREM